jgi:hypothetical protein
VGSGGAAGLPVQQQQQQQQGPSQPIQYSIVRMGVNQFLVPVMPANAMLGPGCLALAPGDVASGGQQVFAQQQGGLQQLRGGVFYHHQQQQQPGQVHLQPQQQQQQQHRHTDNLDMP